MPPAPSAATAASVDGDRHPADDARPSLRVVGPPPCTTSIVIPAHNEESAIAGVVRRVREAVGPETEILVVDDGSTDATAAEAEGAGATVIRRPYRFGNGAAVKTGVRAARGERVCMLDGDGQHDPALIPDLLAALDRYDMAVAARDPATHASGSRRLANGVFNHLASRLSQRDIADLTSGFRAVRTPVAREFLHLLPNQFSYPTTITLACLKAGYSVAWLPTQAAPRVGRSKIRPARDGVHFLTIILKIVTLYSPLRVFVPLAALPAALAAGSLAARFLLGWERVPSAALLLAAGVLVFCIGLVSEQITSLRFERTGASARPADAAVPTDPRREPVHASLRPVLEAGA